ncbi:metalloendoproteinase 1-MMP-like [Panicum miliaceum]|uniref:Metalloendoproteinase 1-MMP-like n=1 Tax=Panicum miliaceum TaxID=4540 RepID=A0A3L6T2L0_PANMI|nr:metalloendoproteinase 1-MMP-like [Panicum miliaceum]
MVPKPWYGDGSLVELKRYLARFGYMPGAEHEPADAFDTHMEAAVHRYQSTLNLSAAGHGQLDSATLDRIMAPRCGVGDNNGHDVTLVSPMATGTGSQGHRRRGQPVHVLQGRAAVDAAGPARAHVRYLADGHVDYLPAETMRAVFRRVSPGRGWVIPLGFVETNDYYAANIRPRRGIPFNRPLGMLGHAFSPRNGRLHLGAAERWAVGSTRRTHGRVAEAFACAMAAAGFARAGRTEVQTGLRPCYRYAATSRGVPPLVLHFWGNATLALLGRYYFMGFRRISLPAWMWRLKMNLTCGSTR